MHDYIPIPKEFIINYLSKALPIFSNIYIYCLSNAYDGRISVRPKDIAKKFNILETDVFNACNYWSDKNLIDMEIDKKGNIIIEFLPMPKTIVESFDNIAIFPTGHANIDECDEIAKKALPINAKPVYSPQELEIYQSNYKEIEHIFSLGEKTLGTLLDASELSTIFGFYDWLRLPIEVIEALFEYCIEKGHKNINYIEKIAIDWAENNITTEDMAKAHINNFNGSYREILNALGQKRRDPTKKEIEYMDKWLYEYKLPMEIILEACDKTIMNLGKPGFSYTDKILNNWAAAKVSTIDDIKALESEYNTKISNRQKVKAVTKKSKFANYTEATIDYDELERVSLELVKSSLKKG